MSLLAEAFALGAAAPAPTLPATRLAARRRAAREAPQRGAPSARAAAATVLVAGVVAKRRMADTRATAVSMRAEQSQKPGGGAVEEPTVTPEPAKTDTTMQAAESAEVVAQELPIKAGAAGGGYLTADQRGMVDNFFFPDEQELDMDKSMPLEDHISELRDGVLRALAFTVVAVGICLYYYKELTTALESPAQAGDMGVKFVQLAPGEFFFVSVKVAFSVGLLIAFPYALFEAALYFAPALTRSERNVVGPTVLGSAILFYSGALFSYSVLSPAALGFFLGYSQDVIESQFSIDQYFEFILSMGFATGISFQVPVLQVALGLLGVVTSEKLFSIWRYVIVGSAIVGAILTPSTDPVTQLLLSGALCALYFAGGGVLAALGR